jgi:hypothetical protein
VLSCGVVRSFGSSFPWFLMRFTAEEMEGQGFGRGRRGGEEREEREEERVREREERRQEEKGECVSERLIYKWLAEEHVYHKLANDLIDSITDELELLEEEREEVEVESSGDGVVTIKVRFRVQG